MPFRPYVVLLMVLPLTQRRLCPVEEKLDDRTDGLIGDGPADEPAVFAGTQGGPEHLDDPRLALCATLCPKDFILSPLDEVEDERLYRGAIAQADAAKGVKDHAPPASALPPPGRE